jgi:IS5 family transposase
VNEVLKKHERILHGRNIVDATVIEAPASTKNRTKSRDPEIHQCKKGNERHFGMKAHIGVDVYGGTVTA